MLFHAKTNPVRQVMALAALVAGAMLLRGGQPFDLQVTPQAIGWALVAAAAIGLTDLIALLLHVRIAGRGVVERIHRTLTEILDGISPAGALGAGLVAGIGEELLFRGALQPRVGLAVTTLLFAAAHLGTRPLLAIAPWVALEGLIFGLLYQQTGNLLYPMVAHGIHDTAAILILQRYNRYALTGTGRLDCSEDHGEALDVVVAFPHRGGAGTERVQEVAE